MSKTLSAEFNNLINRHLPTIVRQIPTPFFLYTEDGIRDACQKLKQAFQSIPGYRNFYAVKANNNPTILEIVRNEGFGFDCSSTSEIRLALAAGASDEDIFFSSNNTSEAEFTLSFESGTLFNFDDISLVDKAPGVPEIACCRYNPGPLARTDGQYVGKPEDAKYGVTMMQAMDFFRIMRDKGVKRFVLHCMICSNERAYENLLLTTRMMLEMVSWISRNLDIRFSAINIGGGFGIPYNPQTDPILDIRTLGDKVADLFMEHMREHGSVPRLYTENGRFVTGHNGVLVTKAINTKSTYREYIGVDAQTFSSVPRPFIYDAYHEIGVFGKDNKPKTHTYDIVGSLCENADKFATQRPFPEIVPGDLLLVHNAGAHCYAMSGNYNGRTRPAEVMIFSDETFGIIRRAQTDEDLFREMIPTGQVVRINL